MVNRKETTRKQGMKKSAHKLNANKSGRKQGAEKSARKQGASKTVNKTAPTGASPAEFIRAVADPGKRQDCQTIARMMRQAVGKPAKMWGSSIVGYGQYRYKYASGREGDWMLTGFSPRAQNLTVYIMPGFADYADLLGKLGKFKTGKSCLYIKSLDDVDQDVLKQLIEQSVQDMKRKYST